MVTLHEMEVEQVKLEDMPFVFRVTNTPGAAKYNTFVRCGAVKRGGNEPYCYPQEKQCAGHICRVLSPDTIVGTATVIRDDNTVWTINFSLFQEIKRIQVI